MRNLVKQLTESSNIIIGKRKHEILLDKIIEGLHQIGISCPTHVFREVGLKKDGNLIGAVDLVVLDSNREVYLIEGKVIGSDKKEIWKVKQGINQQLNRDYDYFKRRYGVLGIRIGVYRRERSDKFKYYRIPRDVGDVFEFEVN